MATTVTPIPPPFFSPYLDDQTNKINSKTVPWEGYQRAQILSPEEINLCKSVQKLPPAQRSTLYSTQSPQYAKLYITLLRKLQRVDTVQSVLASITEMILSDPINAIPAYHALRTDSDGEDELYSGLVKSLGMEEEFVILGSLRILGVLIATDKKPFPGSLIPGLLASLRGLLNGSRIPLWEVAAQVLSAVLGSKQFRIAVWDEEQCISGLVKSLKTNPNPQAQYWAISSLWQLSFEHKAAESMDNKYNIISLLTNIAKSAIKEKVTRLIIALFRNLLTLSPNTNIPSMFTTKLLPFITSLQTRKLSDEDLNDDLTYLSDELKSRLEGMSSWEEYVNELDSGHLVWSPAHESEEFWKENGRRLGVEEGGKGVKRLVELVGSGGGGDEVVVAVAVHDLGMFVKYGGEKAKQTVTDLGGKTKVMELMASENADVRYQALITVQRLMSQHV